MSIETDLSKFNNNWYNPGNKLKVIAWFFLFFNGAALSVTFRRDCSWLFTFVTLLISYAIAIGLTAAFYLTIHYAMK